MTVRVGEKAPEVTFGRGEGGEVSLADLWRGRPLVVAFLRHFG